MGQFIGDEHRTALGKTDDKYIIEVQKYTAKTENSDDDEKENTKKY